MDLSTPLYPIIFSHVDLLFPTEIHGKEYKGKKNLLLNLVREWKRNGIIIPIFYHPELHLIIVRLDDSVRTENAKKFFLDVEKLDYNFEIYMKTKEVFDDEF